MYMLIIYKNAKYMGKNIRFMESNTQSAIGTQIGNKYF